MASILQCVVFSGGGGGGSVNGGIIRELSLHTYLKFSFSLHCVHFISRWS
jgi:hypothetical protein